MSAPARFNFFFSEILPNNRLAHPSGIGAPRLGNPGSTTESVSSSSTNSVVHLEFFLEIKTSAEFEKRNLSVGFFSSFFDILTFLQDVK